VALRRPQSLLVELSGMEAELGLESSGLSAEGLERPDVEPAIARRGQLIIE